jgi:hypothetical protein
MTLTGPFETCTGTITGGEACADEVTAGGGAEAAAGAFAGAAVGVWDSVWVQWSKRRIAGNKKTEKWCFIFVVFRFCSLHSLEALQKCKCNYASDTCSSVRNATMQVMLVQVFDVPKRGYGGFLLCFQEDEIRCKV